MKIGLLGFGTVGKGVYDILAERSDLSVSYVLDLRPLPELEGTGTVVTSDLNTILQDTSVDTVIELIGGMHPAYEFVTASLKAGKNVITANKLMVSKYYRELLSLAAEQNIQLRFSAAAGGGIPWLVNLQRAHRVSRLEAVWGIMNGTTNYILDAMQVFGRDFADALREAQRLGFAEADPSSDIDGLDTRHKTTLSANIAFGVAMDDDAVDTFGIRRVCAGDIAVATEAGYTLKLLGRAQRCGDQVAAWVEPTLVPSDTPEGNIHGCDNIISFEGSHIGKTHFIGAGAGRYPTGYAVAQDCVDLALGCAGLYNERAEEIAPDNNAVLREYYVRGALCDQIPAEWKAAPFGEGIRTQKVPVGEMHALARLAAEKELPFFFAGFAEF